MQKLARFIVHSEAAAYIAALLCLVIWVVWRVEQGGKVDAYACLGLLLCIVIGYLSVKVGRELSFIGAKNALPATLFFMGCAMVPQMIPRGEDVAHLVLSPMVCYLLLRTYRDRNAMGRYFLAFVLVGVECLLQPSLLLTLPFLVICGTFMESLHKRTLLAALWGLLCPYWVVGCMLFLTDRTGVVVSYFGQILPSLFGGASVLDSFQHGAQLCWALLLVIPGSVGIVLDHTMRLQSSAGFRLLITSLVVLLVTIVLFPMTYSELFLCVLFYASLIGSTFFIRNMTRAKNIFLVALLFAWLLMLGYMYGTTF